MVQTYKEGRQMLKSWRDIVVREHPNKSDLLVLIPESVELSLAKLAKCGWVMTDTCKAAQRFRRHFIAAVKEIAKKEGMNNNEIKIFEACKSNAHVISMFPFISLISLTNHSNIFIIKQIVGIIFVMFSLVL